jgi:hypothetical protein
LYRNHFWINLLQSKTSFYHKPKRKYGNRCRPISPHKKGDVERELAQAGILRMTYEWMLGPAEDLSWNSAVVEVMARKSVEWIQLAMRINDNMASQAPTIVQLGLCGKCQPEIQKNQNWDAT